MATKRKTEKELKAELKVAQKAEFAAEKAMEKANIAFDKASEIVDNIQSQLGIVLSGHGIW